VEEWADGGCVFCCGWGLGGALCEVEAQGVVGLEGGGQVGEVEFGEVGSRRHPAGAGADDEFVAVGLGGGRLGRSGVEGVASKGPVFL